eukprot:GEMP01072477.1.p1 GENE.GEMP01072477.1~~GEMP01072477.1.p1  ORF type:complete len:192 (+),score=38.62 GEMP01072477.1:373-948(+)
MFFAGELWDMYARYASTRQWRFSCLSATDSLRVAEVSGKFAPYRALMGESGVHRVIRSNPMDSKGRVHTSSASVVILPLVEESEFAIPTKDLRVDTKKSTGPGGSSVNAAHSAIRLTHIPSGLSVNVTQTSSQIDNRQIALQLLRSRLLAREQEKVAHATALERKAVIGTGDWSEKNRTFNFVWDETVIVI